MSEGMTPISLVILSALGMILLGYIFRHPLKKLFIKEIQAFEEEIVKLEHKL